MDTSEYVESDVRRPAIQFIPVGVVRNQSRDASWGEKLGALTWEARAARMKEQLETVSEIVIDCDVAGALDGIEDFSHLVIVYWPHLFPEDRRRPLRVHPMGNPDFPLVGVFATHSPVRPNPILITVVRLVARRGNVLSVTGLDALDESPVLDIKPYLPGQEVGDAYVPDWMKTLHREFSEREERHGMDRS